MNPAGRRLIFMTCSARRGTTVAAAPVRSVRIVLPCPSVAASGQDVDCNVRMDPRLAGGDINRIRALAQELVGSQPDVILANGTPETAALQRETRTIPIVFVVVADPVGSGFVAKLSQPAGNIIGFAALEASLGSKWLELLLEIAPGLGRAAIMFNPDTAAVSIYMPSFEAAARSPKVVPITAPVHSDVEIETSIIGLGREPLSGLVVMPDTFTVVHRVPIILAAAQNHVPVVYLSIPMMATGHSSE
jgi:putative tryptophan/tyrosine transport system substrate-binding protein